MMIPLKGEQDADFPSLNVALILVLVTFLLMLVAGLLSLALRGNTVVLLSEGLVIVPAWLYVRHSGYSAREVFRLRKIPAQAVWAAGLVGVGATVLGDELDRFVQTLFPMPEEIAKGVEQMLRVHSWSDGVVVFVAIVGLAGLLEEMLFRGLLLGALERTFDVTRAVMLSALLFAFFHLNPWTAVQILVFGVVLGVLAWRSNSVYPAALVHGMNNGFEFAVLNLGEAKLSWLYFRGHVSPVALLAAGVLLYYGFRLFYQVFEREDVDGRG